VLKYIVPRIALADVPAIIAVTAVGGIVAGAYGVIHDQVTYSISAEYFTRLKFDQFRYADLGLGERVFVGTIGFLATWWVGCIMAWFLARRLIPSQPRPVAYRQIRAAFGCVFAICLLFGALAFVYGVLREPAPEYSSLSVPPPDIDDIRAFVRVSHIHSASYLGGVIGFILALVTIRPHRESIASTGG
jgi:hypothetical protein